MQLFIHYLTFAAVAVQITSLKNKFLVNDDNVFESSSAGQYGKVNMNDAKATQIDNIAVFFLGTLTNAQQFGEPDLDHGFYDRSVASRMTWARRAKVFYIVTGAGGPEDRILPNTTYCKSSTAHMRNYLDHVHADTKKFEVYTCGQGREEINVLHLPHCLGNYAGAEGPCCRCQGAMLFYAALHSAHAVHEHKFPEWFTFSDDDYYMRLEYLEAIVETAVSPHEREYALVPSVMMETVHTKTKATERPNYGLFRQGNCTSPCLFRVPWMGWAGFSIGAIKKLEARMAQNSLVDICHNWGVTHDIGLGVLTWMHSIQYIEITMGRYAGYSADGDGFEQDAVIWHKAFDKGMLYDTLFDLIWNKGDMKEKRSFDHAAFKKQEIAQGGIYNQQNRMYPNGGFKNTMFYRELTFHQAIASQIQEGQRSAAFNTSVVDYVPDMCTRDRDIFDKWEDSHPVWKNAEHNTHGVVINQPKQCIEYSVYINNIPINFNQAELPDLDEMYRKKRDRKKRALRHCIAI